jgi:hypothetical protein
MSSKSPGQHYGLQVMHGGVQMQDGMVTPCSKTTFSEALQEIAQRLMGVLIQHRTELYDTHDKVLDSISPETCQPLLPGAQEIQQDPPSL